MYVCIPTSNTSEELWTKTFKEVNMMSAGGRSGYLLETMTWGLMKFSSELMTKSK